MQAKPTDYIYKATESAPGVILWPLPLSKALVGLLIGTNLASSLFLLLMLLPTPNPFSRQKPNDLLKTQIILWHYSALHPLMVSRLLTLTLTPPLSSHPLWWTHTAFLWFLNMTSSLPCQAFCILYSFYILFSFFPIFLYLAFFSIFISELRYYIVREVRPDPQC